MKKLILKEKYNNIYFFSNPETGNENENFGDKETGAKILIDYTQDGIISASCALQLINKIINLRNLPFSPKGKIDQLFSDMRAVLFVSEARKRFKKLSVVENSENLPAFIACPNCGLHGFFVGAGFETNEFEDKKTGFGILEDLFFDNQINEVEKEKLKEELNSSNLPPTSIEEQAELN